MENEYQRSITAASEDAENTELHGEKRRGELLYHKTTGVILGAFYAVHSELGHGFLEAVYGNALSIVLTRAGLRVDREVPFEIGFRGHQIGVYRADFVVDARVIVEIKAAAHIVPAHVAQVINYLKASDIPVGLLLNFGERPRFKRVLWTHSSSQEQHATEDTENTELHGKQLL